jgi:hypothetical protein
MGRIVVENGSYIRMKTNNEGDFEELILKFSADLFPHATLVEWKPLAYSQSGVGTQPDLMLWTHDLSAWWIIEVEITKNLHYARTHIATQLSKQANADWSVMRDKLAVPMKENGYSEDDIEHLAFLSPGFLLICDDYDKRIHEIARNNNFQYMVAEPMVSDIQGYCLHVTREGVNIPPPETGIFFDVGYGPEVTQSEYLGGGWWINLPPNVIENLHNRDELLVEYDGIRHLAPIIETATRNRICLPYSIDESSDTNKVIHKTADARFHLIGDAELQRLCMAIKRRFFND